MAIGDKAGLETVKEIEGKLPEILDTASDELIEVVERLRVVCEALLARLDGAEIPVEIHVSGKLGPVKLGKSEAV